MTMIVSLFSVLCLLGNIHMNLATKVVPSSENMMIGDKILTSTEYLQNWFYNLTAQPYYQKSARPAGRCVTDRPSTDKVGKELEKSEQSHRKSTIVDMSLELYNYATVNELTSEYTFQFFLDLEWCDERLVIPESRVADFRHFGKEESEILVEGGNVHIERIWRPSIFVANNDNPGSIDYDAQSSNMIRIDIKEGHVWLRKRKLLHIYCMMDFSLYPFDRQRCNVHFESNVHSVNNVQLQWGKVVLGRQYITSDGTAQQIDEQSALRFSEDNFQTIGFNLIETRLTSSNSSSFSRVNYSRCTFAFTLEREFHHYVVLAYLPSGLIVLVSWTTFWLEITSPPARVSLGVTTMLALVTSFKTSKSQLPTNSYLNVLDIWNLVCTIFIAFSLVEFAAVNYIYNTNKRFQVKEMIRKKSEKIRRNQRPRPNLVQSDSEFNSKYLENTLNQILANQKQMKSFNDFSKFQNESLSKIASINAILKKEANKSSTDIDRITELNSEPALLSYSNISSPENSTPKPTAKRSDSVVTFATDPLTPSSPQQNTAIPETSNDHPNGSSGNSSPVNGILKRPLYRVLRKASTSSFGSQQSTGTEQSGSVQLCNGQSSYTRKERRRSILLSNNASSAIIKKTPEEMANMIDKICRYFFPAMFVLFNIVYWTWVGFGIQKSHLSVYN